MILNPRRTLMLLLFFLIAVLYQSCDVTQQTQHAVNIAKCEFRIRSVENINLAGIYIQNSNSIKSLNLTDAAKIMAAMGGSTFPLSLDK